MKIERIVKEGINLGDSHEIKEIKIGKKDYELKIDNIRGGFGLDFNDGDFTICINEKGLYFSRTLHRPRHDHNDTETYQIAVHKNSGKPIGTMEWRSRFPHEEEGWEMFYIEFGSKTVDY